MADGKKTGVAQLLKDCRVDFRAESDGEDLAFASVHQGVVERMPPGCVASVSQDNQEAAHDFAGIGQSVQCPNPVRIAPYKSVLACPMSMASTALSNNAVSPVKSCRRLVVLEKL